MKIAWDRYSSSKADPYWRAARIAARILRKQDRGLRLRARDRRLAAAFIEEDGVSNRLIDQALACLQAPQRA